MTPPEPTEVSGPRLGAALIPLELADLRSRPWWAAHRVAAGLGGERLAELARLSGDEREISDPWPYRDDFDDDEAPDAVVYAVEELLDPVERAQLARRPSRPQHRRGLLLRRDRDPEVSEQRERE